MNLFDHVKRFARDEEGVTAIEYGLIAALIAIVIVAAVRATGTNLNTLWGRIRDEVGTAAN